MTDGPADDGRTNESQHATPGSIAALTLEWARNANFAHWFSRETTSTNTIAKSRVTATAAHSKPQLFLAERQTAGRGRGTHTWTTPPNALLSTWSYSLAYSPQPILSPLIGLALYDAAQRAFTDVAFNLKAPNDLYVGDRKIAGLLIETVQMGAQVTSAVGLGFNAGSAPADLPAVGLAALVSSDAITRAWPTFLDSWIDGLEEAFAESRSAELTSAKRERLRDALNLHPLLAEKILNVGAMGQIQTASRLIHWHEL